MSILTTKSELISHSPDFGDHTWRDPPLLEITFFGSAGSGKLYNLECSKCGYKVGVHFGFQLKPDSVKLRLSYHYDPEEICAKVQMNEALS